MPSPQSNSSRSPPTAHEQRRQAAPRARHRAGGAGEEQREVHAGNGSGRPPRGGATSFRRPARDRWRDDSSDARTGVTSDQCPTGQRWIRQNPSRSDFTDAAGSQIVENRWPRRQRTIRFPPRRPLRSQVAAASSTTAARAASTKRSGRRLRGGSIRPLPLARLAFTGALSLPGKVPASAVSVQPASAVPCPCAAGSARPGQWWSRTRWPPVR